MLFAACATTRPTIASPSSPQLTVTSPVSPSAPTASSPPTRPDVTVIENTAARVITSHLLIASGGADMPSGRLAVFRIVRQVAIRPGAGEDAVIAVGPPAGYVRSDGSRNQATDEPPDAPPGAMIPPCTNPTVATTLPP